MVLSKSALRKAPRQLITQARGLHAGKYFAVASLTRPIGSTNSTCRIVFSSLPLLRVHPASGIGEILSTDMPCQGIPRTERSKVNRSSLGKRNMLSSSFVKGFPRISGHSIFLLRILGLSLKNSDDYLASISLLSSLQMMVAFRKPFCDAKKKERSGEALRAYPVPRVGDL